VLVPRRRGNQPGDVRDPIGDSDDLDVSRSVAPTAQLDAQCTNPTFGMRRGQHW
jgi:hypothetical protein